MPSQFEYSYAETLLKVSNAGMTIGTSRILRDINLEVKNIVRPGMSQGQVVGFLGPSGVGKTKFSEMLAGIIVPEKNKIFLDGEILVGANQLPTKIGRVGMVQQKYPLLVHRSVNGNLMVVALNKYKDHKVSSQKVLEIMETLNLVQHKDKYPAELSGGTQQRVAIAQALLSCEDFLIFDEPFSGLDVNMIGKVTQLIQNITSINEFLTVVIISHDISATCAISDSLWLMGKEKDEKGVTIPGGTIRQDHVYDLVSLDLAWHPDITYTKTFLDLTTHIKKDIFPILGG